MYAGTTLTPVSGRIIGAHQKIDRVARRHLKTIIADNTMFPGTNAILHFEGFNGPDAIKRKSPAKDEPWHFYSPFNEDDSQLIELIKQHYKQLVKDLQAKDKIRASFEAAWLAHAITDGLTPAHHYPYEEKLGELRGEDGNEARSTLKEKLVMPGTSHREAVKNNWKMWGPKGLMSTHGLFEIGIATLITPLSFNGAEPTANEINECLSIGLIELFKRRAREIAVLDMFDNYYKKGWTLKLMVEVRNKLVPTIINTVTLVWFLALVDAELIKPPKTKKL